MSTYVFLKNYKIKTRSQYVKRGYDVTNVHFTTVKKCEGRTKKPIWEWWIIQNFKEFWHWFAHVRNLYIPGSGALDFRVGLGPPARYWSSVAVNLMRNGFFLNDIYKRNEMNRHAHSCTEITAHFKRVTSSLIKNHFLSMSMQCPSGILLLLSIS